MLRGNLYPSVLAVDPGVSGGFAYIDHSMTLVVLGKFEDMSLDDMWFNLDMHAVHADKLAIEKVNASPPQRGADRRSGTKSMFTFGQSFGRLEGILMGTRKPLEYVTPQAWQKSFGLVGINTSRTVKKNAHKDIAKKLLLSVPKVEGNLTHATADAFLIAMHARSQSVGQR